MKSCAQQHTQVNNMNIKGMSFRYYFLKNRIERWKEKENTFFFFTSCNGYPNSIVLKQLFDKSSAYKGNTLSQKAQFQEYEKLKKREIVILYVEEHTGKINCAITFLLFYLHQTKEYKSLLQKTTCTTFLLNVFHLLADEMLLNLQHLLSDFVLKIKKNILLSHCFKCCFRSADTNNARFRSLLLSNNC